MGLSYSEKGKGIVRKKECVFVVDGCLYILDHNNLPSKRELLGQVQPLGRTGDCSFPERAGGVCERPSGQDWGRAEHGESPEHSRELVTTG